MATKKISFAAGHVNKVAAANRSSQTRVDAAQMFVRLASGDFIDLYDALEQLNDDLASEAVDRAAGDAALQVNIDAEEVARIAGDSSLETRLGSEEAARAAADSSIDVVMAAIQADVDANEAASDAAEASLETRLAAEEGEIGRAHV